MKKIITTLILLAFAVSAFAQIEYLPTENRHSGYGTPPKPQRTSEVVTTTAYTISGDSYVKARIRVEISTRRSAGYGGVGSEYVKVVEIYKTQGMGYLSQWEKVYPSGLAEKCSPMTANNPLESQFMYKARIGMNTWYFDL